MGYSVSAWKADGRGEAMIVSHSVKRVSEIPAIVAHLKTLPRVVLILKERSNSKTGQDSRKPVGYRVYELWRKPGYTSETD